MILIYIFIVLLIAAVIYLWFQVKELKNTKIVIKENNKGEAVLTYKNQEILNYKLEKR